MNAVDTPLTTHRLGAPSNWDAAQNGDCSVLPVVADGVTIASYWKPSREELAALVAGGLVRLSVFSGGQPPVAVDVMCPEFTHGVNNPGRA